MGTPNPLPPRSHVIPVLIRNRVLYPIWPELSLNLVSTPVASKLTGISTDKLREWTSRRALIPADVRPQRKGSPAKFAWQTILVLRLAVLLRDHLAVELEAYSATLTDLRDHLRATSFIGLWGRRVALAPCGSWSFLDEGNLMVETDALILHLDPHLVVIRDGFSLPDAATAAGQLDLFSLPVLQGKWDVRRRPQATALPRRRSA